MELSRPVVFIAALCMVYLATTALKCSRDAGLSDPNLEFVVNLTVIKHNQSSERIHIFRDVLETFGVGNRLEPGDSVKVFIFDEVESGDDVNWVAGRDGVPFDQVGCIVPSGTRDAVGNYNATVTVVWHGASLSCEGWQQR